MLGREMSTKFSSKSLQAYVVMRNLMKVYSYYLEPQSFIQHLGGHAHFYIITAARHWIGESNMDNHWVPWQSDRELSYPVQVNKIKAKIEAHIKRVDIFSQSHVEIYSYARMISVDIRDKPNGWGKAVVSARFVALRESSLNHAGHVRTPSRPCTRSHSMAAHSQLGICFTCSLCARYSSTSRILAVHGVPDLARKNIDPKGIRRTARLVKQHSRPVPSELPRVPLRW
jgi:hypothetical protein